MRRPPGEGKLKASLFALPLLASVLIAAKPAAIPLPMPSIVAPAEVEV